MSFEMSAESWVAFSLLVSIAIPLACYLYHGGEPK